MKKKIFEISDDTPVGGVASKSTKPPKSTKFQKNVRHRFSKKKKMYNIYDVGTLSISRAREKSILMVSFFISHR